MVIRKQVSVLAVLVLVASRLGAAIPDRDFTYQGVLTEGGSPADGLYDLRFRLFDAASGGAEISRVELADERVSNGRLTAVLDLGDPFDGRALWLQIEVRPGASTAGYTALTPRQPVTGAPYASVAGAAGHAATASSATTAGDADTLDGQHGAYYRAWSSLTGVPAGLGDGDDDALGELSCTTGQVAVWNGSAWTCATDQGVAFRRTIVVHGTGDPTVDGAALLAAVGALGVPTAQPEARRVRLEPGVYDLGAESLSIPPWVLLEGAGRETTVVTSSACSAGGFPAAAIVVDSDSEVRDLTAVSTCGSPTGSGSAVIVWGDRARLTRVTARHMTAADRCTGVWVVGEGTALERVTAEAGGGASWTIGILVAGDGTLLLDCHGSAIDGGYHNALLVDGWTRVMGGAFTADHAIGSGDSAVEISAETELYDVTVASEGDAVHLSIFDTVLVTMSRVDIRGKVSVSVDSGDSLGLIIEHSRIVAPGPTVDGHAGAVIMIAATLLSGDPVQPDGGIVACAGVWDEGWLFHPNTCP